MENTKKIYETELFQPQNTTFETKKLASLADTVKVELCAKANDEMTFKLIGYDKQLISKTLYSKTLSSDTDGNINFEYSFDPVSLFVYENADNFSVMLKGATEVVYLNVFENCNSLTDIYFSGNEEQKGNISFGSGNDALFSANWHYNYEN